jgi:hypothetical protein
MSGTPDTVKLFLNAIQSGLVVSGNNHISAGRVMTSGDTMSSLKVSGMNNFIGLRLSRDTTNPMTGNTYTEVCDIVTAEILYRDFSVNSSGVTDSGSSVAVVSQLVSDYKLTVSGFAWSGVAPPRLFAETHPYAMSQVAKADVSYRVRYLL